VNEAWGGGLENTCDHKVLEYHRRQGRKAEPLKRKRRQMGKHKGGKRNNGGETDRGTTLGVENQVVERHRTRGGAGRGREKKGVIATSATRPRTSGKGSKKTGMDKKVCKPVPGWKNYEGRASLGKDPEKIKQRHQGETTEGGKLKCVHPKIKKWGPGKPCRRGVAEGQGKYRNQNLRGQQGKGKSPPLGGRKTTPKKKNTLGGF